MGLFFVPKTFLHGRDNVAPLKKILPSPPPTLLELMAPSSSFLGIRRGKEEGKDKEPERAD